MAKPSVINIAPGRVQVSASGVTISAVKTASAEESWSRLVYRFKMAVAGSSAKEFKDLTAVLLHEYTLASGTRYVVGSRKGILFRMSLNEQRQSTILSRGLGTDVTKEDVLQKEQIIVYEVDPTFLFPELVNMLNIIAQGEINPVPTKSGAAMERQVRQTPPEMHAIIAAMANHKPHTKK